VQEIAPDKEEYMPEEQLKQLNTVPETANSEYFPGGQVEPLEQSDDCAPPADNENMPARHAVQPLDPGIDEYVLGGHRMQLEESLAPTEREYAPAGHGVHALIPRLSANVPWAHCTQDPLPLPYRPAAHSSRYCHNVDASEGAKLTPFQVRTYATCPAKYGSLSTFDRPIQLLLRDAVKGFWLLATTANMSPFKYVTSCESFTATTAWTQVDTAIWSLAPVAGQ